MDFKEILSRAGKTFFQASTAYLLINIQCLLDISDKENLGKIIFSLVIGTVASGISAIQNTLLNNKE